MNYKNILILALILIVFWLGYGNFFNKKTTEQLSIDIQTENGSEDHFARNQECLMYKDEISKKLETKDSTFDKTSLEQIFYSPKTNSCLYVEYSFSKGDLLKGEYAYSRRIFDIFDDGYSSHPLADCYSLELGDEQECTEFEQTLNEYK